MNTQNAVTQPSPTAPADSRQKQTLAQVAPSFDVRSIRCGVEARLDARIGQNENLTARFQGLEDGVRRARAQMRINLLTDGYKVDREITPKLHRLGITLRKILRLTQPLDVFVIPDHELNAFCLPSRNGTRLVMCLNSGLLAHFTTHELLFVMGHEAGHALLAHGERPVVTLDNPNFSPLEVAKLRALQRAQEVSCDRMGLLACQSVRVACQALFKIASGLSNQWINFSETAYSRHFDELSSMAEIVDLIDVDRSHPLTPLRVKALIAFSKSELFSKAFNRSNWSIGTQELDQGVQGMLSTLYPDFAELSDKEETRVANQFLFNGALLVIAADGIIDPEEVAWLKSRFEGEWNQEKLAAELSKDSFHIELKRRLEENASILRKAWSEIDRANLFRLLCEAAASAGGIVSDEMTALNQLRILMDIRPELASQAHEAAEEGAGSLQDLPDLEPIDEAQTAGGTTKDEDLLSRIMERAKLTEKRRELAERFCDRIREAQLPVVPAIRMLVAWGIFESRRGGALTEAQGKRLAIAAIKTCQDILVANGARRKATKGSEALVSKYGVVALFRKGEVVTGDPDGTLYIVQSVSRTTGRLKVAPQESPENITEADAREFLKDVNDGIWPDEL